ncbi:MAG: LysR family transcriptional regulator [Burkholderiales bacterium]|jgi:LysR family hydrogen peroxide-inducible transcriptional activator|nr:LysR family transcriptional regulator [Burkholderiales bacterium]
MFITLTELRYIVAVANEKHFGKAASKCFVSQPTLSIAIKKFEINLGVVLFERNKSQVTITDIGHEIINKAAQILESADGIEEFAKLNNDIYSQPLKIGAINSVGPYLFPRLVTKIKTSPIKLIIEEGFTEILTNKLLAGEIDAIIVAKPFDKPNLATISLYTEPLKVILPKSHILANKKTKINPRHLVDETLLLLDTGNCFREQVIKICPDCIIPKSDNKKMVITTSSIETIKYMVANGIGISIVPSFSLTESQQSLFVIKEFIKPIPTREIVIAVRKSFYRMPVIHELSSIIQTIYQ